MHCDVRPPTTPPWPPGAPAPPTLARRTPTGAPSRTMTTSSPDSPADGLVLVDKPAGWTSHDVVARVRRLAGTRKVGHAGTLDPMATGLLVLGVNRATRLLTYLVGADKTYTATVRLGQETITDDAEGEVTRARGTDRSEEHTSELQSRGHLVCRLLLEKKNTAVGDTQITHTLV